MEWIWIFLVALVLIAFFMLRAGKRKASRYVEEVLRAAESNGQAAQKQMAARVRSALSNKSAQMEVHIAAGKLINEGVPPEYDTAIMVLSEAVSKNQLEDVFNLDKYK